MDCCIAYGRGWWSLAVFSVCCSFSGGEWLFASTLVVVVAVVVVFTSMSFVRGVVAAAW
jgi:hypothetical protein